MPADVLLISAPGRLADELAERLEHAGCRVARRSAPRSRLAALVVVAWLRVAAGPVPSCVVTVSPPSAAHIMGWALRHPGRTWIAHLTAPWPAAIGGRRRRLLHPAARLLQSADLVTGSRADVLDRIHAAVGATVAPSPSEDPARLAHRVATCARRSGARRGGLRVLMLGPTNSPHLEDLALAMRDLDHEVVVAGEPTPAYPPSLLVEQGVRVVAQRFPATRWLRRLLREVRPDVVHAHWLSGAAFLAAVVRATPLVASAWGSDVFGAGPWGLRACRFTIRRADVVVTDSQALLDRLTELGARPTSTRLVNWGVDLRTFRPPEDRAAARRALGLGAGAVVLSPRALTPVYNPGTIVAAFERVSARFPDAQLVLKHVAAEPPALDRPLPVGVHVVGHVPYARMAEYYRAADVCVSVPGSDSSPRSVWEAMACGCPCVLSDLPWVRELIVPGRDALVVAPQPESVAEAIESLLTDIDRAASIGAAGRRLAEAHRDRDAEMRRLSDLYRDVARRRARA